MFNMFKNALNQAIEYTKEFDIPISQSMINVRLSEIKDDNPEIGAYIKSLQVELHDGYFDVLAIVNHNGINTDNRLSFTFEEFDCHFGTNDKQTVTIKQKNKPELTGQNWFSKAVVGTVRGILETATKSDLPQWALGKVDGITISGDLYIFDLIKLDVKNKLISGILSAINQNHPLLKLAMEKAIGLYSIKGATCKDKNLTLHVRMND